MMELREFLFKNVLLPFFIITSLVSVGAGILGMLYTTDAMLPYHVLFMPAFYGIATSIPSVVLYSKKELSSRSLTIRKIIQVALIELLVLGINFFAGNLTSVSITVSLFLMVLIISATTTVVAYINDRRTASEINAALKQLQGGDNSDKD